MVTSLPGVSNVLSPSDTLNVSFDKSITKELGSNVIRQDVTTSDVERDQSSGSQSA